MKDREITDFREVIKNLKNELLEKDRVMEAYANDSEKLKTHDNKEFNDSDGAFIEWDLKKILLRLLLFK